MVSPHKEFDLSSSITDTYRSYSDQYLERCRRGPDFPYTPLITQDLGFDSNPKSSRVVESSGSFANIKAYTLSSRVARSLFLGTPDSHLEHTPDVSDQQRGLILHKSSSIIISGRSGTGKTTVILHRMLQQEMADSLSRGADDATELPQLFLTRSPVLAKAVEQSYRKMLSAALPSTATATAEKKRGAGVEGAAVYPQFQTYTDLLRHVDSTLESPFLQPDDPRKEMDFAMFKSLSLGVGVGVGVGLGDVPSVSLDILYTEITSVILGSLQSLKSDCGFLDRAAYTALSEKRHGKELSYALRNEIFDFYEKYNKMKRASGFYDIADYVFHVFSALSKEGYRYRGNKMENVYVDEVQDLTQGQICILKVCGMTFTCTKHPTPHTTPHIIALNK